MSIDLDLLLYEIGFSLTPIGAWAAPGRAKTTFSVIPKMYRNSSYI